MFDGIRNFFNLLDVDLFWPVLIIALSFVSCLIPYKPVAKIKETKDKNGDKVYTIYRYRE